MIDDRDVIERLAPLFPPHDGGLEACLQLRDRRQLNRRIGAIALAAVVTAALVGSLVSSVDRSKQRPADTGPITPSNVSDLRVAWSATTVGDPRGAVGLEGMSVDEGTLYVVTPRDATISAFPVDCEVADGSCAQRWSGRIPVQRHGGCAPVPCVGVMPAGPTVADGLVFTGSLHHLAAFPVDCVGTCRPTWSGVIDDPDGIVHQAVVADGVVYAGTGGGHLYAFPASCEGRCEPLWVSQRQPTSLRITQVVDGIVYAGTDEYWGSATSDAPGYVMGYAFPAACSERCRPLWTTRMDRTANAMSLTAVGETVYVGGSADRGRMTLSAYRADCGIRDRCRSWMTSLPAAAADLLVVDGVLVVTIPNVDQVRAFPLDCEDGCQPLWSASVPGLDGRPVGGNGLAFFATSGGVTAVALECGAGGATCQPIEVTARDASAMAAGDGRLFVRSSNGRVTAFAPRTGSEIATTDEEVDVVFPVAVLVATSFVAAIAFIRSRRRLP
jgi:outer membrane protein assembly factor BamB